MRSTTLTLMIAGMFALKGTHAVAQVEPPPITIPVAFEGLPNLGRVQAINRPGDIVGYTMGGNETQGFLYSQGALTFIEISGASQSTANGIANNGRIVGSYQRSDHAGSHGFLLEGGPRGNVVTIDFPNGNDTVARDINNPGDIVGYFRDASGRRHGFFYRNGNFDQIDVAGASATYAYGVNDRQDIVGYFTDDAGHHHGFLNRRGEITTIDVPFPDVTDTFLFGINNPGIIVGSYIDSAGTHGFVYARGTFAPVEAPETPPGIGTLLRHMNDDNQIVLFGVRAFRGQVGSLP